MSERDPASGPETSGRGASGPGASAVELITVRADNPGPMTLDGTNSHVLRDGDQVWCVDPGPRDPGHLAELLLRCGDGARPQGVLVTHRHLDHTAGAATLARQLSARSGHEVPLWAADPSAVPGSQSLPSSLEGEHGTVGRVLPLPGHTSDSVGVLVDGGRLLSGDTLLGGSSTVIIPEDGGSLTDHLRSLALLRDLALDGRIASIHPGHGEAFATPRSALAAIEAALAHRRERIEQVRRARAAGALTVEDLLRAVYGAELPEALRGAARWNLRATLDHLAEGR